MKSILKIVLICLAFSSEIASQNVSQEWVSRYNGTANTFDGGYSLTLDGTGNLYVTGSSFGAGSSRDYLTIKYNTTGQAQWIQRYNGLINAGDYSFSVAVDGSGNVYVTGRSDRGGNNLSDLTTIKYNFAGIEQWVTHYNGTTDGVDEGIKVLVDNSGNVYVTGRSLGFGTDQDIITIKYNPTNGAILWAKRYNGPGNSIDIAHSMVLDASGNIYVAGESIGSATGQDFVVIKYDPQGTELWVPLRYNGPGNGGDVAKSIGLDGSGNVFVTGYSDGGSTLHDYATLKYNSSGVQQWLQRYNGTGGGGDFANSLAIDASGNVFVTGGIVGSSGLNDSNFATVKYNSLGVQQWVAIYGGPGNSIDIGRQVVLDNNGNSYVTGGSIGSVLYDYTTIKYNSLGTEQWNIKYNGPGNNDDYSNSLGIDGFGNVFVTGRSIGSGTDYDFATIKYSQVVGIKPISNEIPKSYSLSQNYPNPFNPNTIIKFDIPKSSNVELKVCNIMGQEVSVIVNSYLQAGSYQINFDGSIFTSGVYLYRLKSGDFTAVRKMILMR